jgi:glucose dehydrogenase
MSVDHQKGLLYLPVANPAPDFYGAARPGLNLYTNSMVVLDIKTGKKDQFDQELTEFSTRYADQNDRDFKAFTEAIRSGRLPVLEGV